MDRTVYERMRQLQDRHWWFRGRRRVISRVLATCALPPGAAIAEVGCGVGGNIGMLQAFGDVVAVEPDADSRAYVARTRGVTVLDGRLPDDLPLGSAAFDLVCAFDVLEHVVEDRASAAALGALVKPGGVVVATVPAYGWMWSSHDEAHHHKRRYSLREARALFESSGLTVITSSYFNTLLFPIAAAVRGAKRLTRATGEDDRMPPPAINSVLAGLFGLEAGLVARGGLPFGLSIVVVARRAQ